MRVTIADVARNAAVSKTTVSRVLNGKGEVDAETAERVRAVIAELGYVPSSRAVGLARGNSRTLAMLVPSLTWPWVGEVLQGVADTLEAAGYGLLLFTCNRGEESMAQFTSQVSARAFDGVLAIEPENTRGAIAALHHQGLPLVLVDDRGQGGTFPSVATTNREGAASAAQHLIAAGRRAPLVVTGPAQFGCVQDRLHGFARVFAEHGAARPDSHVFEGDFTVRCGQRVIDHALAERLPFDSVFCHNDLSATGVLQALRAAGRRVPDDVAVIGFDDIPSAAYTEPSLTTVRQPMQAMGEAAARRMLDHLRGVTPLRRDAVVLPTELVIRSSAPG
ncbi:LacI family DNA-binding transcriptional regulator [Streptomyces sp. DSM 44915]|uniref:LacI family DNA-binding transcriptional regulator n=1 Tax=Streptomyces chisholmiae TaxID=3075540 RepID=A0ABU2JUM0_9ACTN|nr:LacI family DNA-binding transcriptional regulator [Streptomyces sp. DSM 44915]MDT0268438.1 LacI family DNA-binding transcriptional regulator [Streptomyces sp. DSM 44915]